MQYSGIDNRKKTKKQGSSAYKQCRRESSELQNGDWTHESFGLGLVVSTGLS